MPVNARATCGTDNELRLGEPTWTPGGQICALSCRTRC
jgi:hypothetical protein